MNFIKSIIAVMCLLTTLSCQKSGPVDIRLGKDRCENCRMIISQLGYAAELVWDNGDAYKFDDLNCMNIYKTSDPEKTQNAKQYVIDYSSGKFLEKEKATLVKGGRIKSPMGGNTQAYQNISSAEKAAAALGANVVK